MELEADGWQRLGSMDRFREGTITGGALKNHYGQTVEIAVVRTGLGLDIVLDRCPHQGVAFTDRGCINEHQQLVCTWHDWTFNLPKGCPGDRPGVKMQSIESKVVDDVLWARPGPNLIA